MVSHIFPEHAPRHHVLSTGRDAMSKTPSDTPIRVAAERGEVLLDGPDGLATSLTPQAAKQSAEHLHRAADLADRRPNEEFPWNHTL
jgi:hypothetical protein